MPTAVYQIDKQLFLLNIYNESLKLDHRLRCNIGILLHFPQYRRSGQLSESPVFLLIVRLLVSPLTCDYSILYSNVNRT